MDLGELLQPLGIENKRDCDIRTIPPPDTRRSDLPVPSLESIAKPDESAGSRADIDDTDSEQEAPDELVRTNQTLTRINHPHEKDVPNVNRAPTGTHLGHGRRPRYPPGHYQVLSEGIAALDASSSGFGRGQVI